MQHKQIESRGERIVRIGTRVVSAATMSMRPQEVKLPEPKNHMKSVLSMESDSAAMNTSTALKLSDLTETERSAASLGVSPDEWKPIGWLNEAHYEALLKENRIDAELAKKVEAFRHVASGGK